MKWYSLLAACALAGVAGAQDTATSRGVSVSGVYAGGVYTRAQAARGKNVYAGSCRSCHSPQSHTGETFESWWGGKRLSELFTFVSTQMPKNDPGSLAPEDVADVVAYLLEINALPPGKGELHPQPDSLRRFVIELKSRQSTRKKEREPRSDP